LRGECAISWWVIGFAASLLRTHYYHHPRYIWITGAHNAYLMFRLGHHGALKPIDIKFLELFRLAAGFVTTDSRDSIFALLGIQTSDHNPVDHPLILPDYGVEEDDLHLTFAEALLQTESPLAFLFNTESDRSCRGLPSWLPDWKSRQFAEILAPWSLDEQFNASQGLEFSGRLDQTRKHLLVSGVHVSTILCCGSDWHSTVEFYIKEVDQFADLGLLSAAPEVLSLLSRTLSGGRTQYGGRQSDPNALLKHFAALYASEDTRKVLKLSNATNSFISRHGKLSSQWPSSCKKVETVGYSATSPIKLLQDGFCSSQPLVTSDWDLPGWSLGISSAS
jgi:hypothetical protein